MEPRFIIATRLEAERRRTLLADRLASGRGSAAIAAALALTAAVVVAIVELSRYEAALELAARV